MKRGLLCLVLVLAGCGPAQRFEGDAIDDTAGDAAEVDAHLDGAEDPAADLAEDPVEDTVADTVEDSPMDTAVDTTMDTVPDAVVDTVVDTAVDTAIDTAVDTAVDTTMDTVPDTIVDTGPDSVVTPGTDCAHAIDATSLASWSGSFSGFSNLWSGGSGCLTANGREIWFEATVAAGDLFILEETTSTDVVIHRLGSCTSTSCLWSGDYTERYSFYNDGTGPVRVIIVVEAYYSYETGPVALSISNGHPPDGNLCSDAVDITSYRSWSADFSDYGDLWDAPSGCGGSTGPEVWFTATVPDGHIFTLTERGSTDVVLALLASCSATSCIDYWDTPESFSRYNGTGATMTLTIAVERYFSGGGIVDVEPSVVAAFAGSMCTQAIDVSSATSWTGHFDDYVDLWDGGSSCGSAGGSEVWFRATVPAGYTFSIEETTSTDVVIERVASCSSTSCIAYVDFTELLTYTNSASTSLTITLVVESYFSSGGPIALTISNAP